MSFSPETQQIIAEVERLSGRPVHVEEDANIKTLAQVTPARGASPAHFVRYQPGNPAADYLVAYQLGFVVRLFSCPPDQRFDLISTPEEDQAAIAELGLTGLPEPLTTFLRSSLLTQLRTCPVGIRLDRWIRDRFPGLQPAQHLAAKQQLLQNEASLNPDLRNRFPKALVDINTAMNAAFALFWAAETNEPRLVIPYSLLGVDTAGRRLLALLEEIPDDPAHDKPLIEAWAKDLGMERYFHFKPHSLNG
jgi:hypothetical protein